MSSMPHAHIMLWFVFLHGLEDDEGDAVIQATASLAKGGRMEIYHVDPSTVRMRSPYKVVTERDWRHQAERLQAEGQIEPIEVIDLGEKWERRYKVAPDAWTYAEAQVIAAMELGWETILVTY